MTITLETATETKKLLPLLRFFGYGATMGLQDTVIVTSAPVPALEQLKRTLHLRGLITADEVAHAS